MAGRASLFERLFIHPRRPWLPIGAALLLWLIPFVGAALADQPALLSTTAILFGLLAWVIYVTVARTQVTAAILARRWPWIRTTLAPLWPSVGRRCSWR